MRICSDVTTGQYDIKTTMNSDVLTKLRISVAESLCRPGVRHRSWIHQEVAREVNQLLGRIFAQRHNSGRTDLEAVESALRAALHQAGASALSALLQYEAPAPEQRQLPCACGH